MRKIGDRNFGLSPLIYGARCSKCGIDVERRSRPGKAYVCFECKQERMRKYSLEYNRKSRKNKKR